MKIWKIYQTFEFIYVYSPRFLLSCILLVIFFGTSQAMEQQNLFSLPPKITGCVVPPGPDIVTIRQGGDTIADAFDIFAIPFSSQGTTSGYTDNYDEACPYSGSISPDVVYSYTPEIDISIDIDLCGSAYDTKVYVYDSDLNVIACNDDFYFDDECGVYVSRVEYVELQGGTPYYFVVDGWGGEFGDYLFVVTEFEPTEPCILVCPEGGLEEGEPPLEDEYYDNYNCGCNCTPWVFQDITGNSLGEQIFCGISGWYEVNGNPRRDTDWFHLAVPAHGTTTLVIDSEAITEVRHLDLGCNLGVLQSVLSGPCEPGTMVFENDSDVPYIARIGVFPIHYEAPPSLENEYSYVMWLTGLDGGTVATETKKWGSLKTIWR